MDHNMTMNSESLAPFVINLPYGQYSREAFEKAFDESLEKQMGRSVNDSELEHFMLRYVLAYPTVYVVYSGKTNRYSMKNEYTVYVGETNDIRHRAFQHLERDAKEREDWKAVADAVSRNDDAYRQYVISHPKFNKSLTLEVVPEFLRTLVFARPRGDDQFADCTFSPSLDMSR